MARKPRIHVDGGFYHVILRGNDGDKIFFSHKDRSRLFLLLQEGIARFHYRLHAYCLMSNHIHLVIQVGIVPLSKIIQKLSFRYTKYINKKKNRIGHLFQGRYKAILIDADSYMLELVRYIHNNPVRANMVERAGDYRWSSHQVCLGIQELFFLTTDWLLSQFAKTVSVSRIKFSDFVENGDLSEKRTDFYTGTIDSRVLGDDRFLEKLQDYEPLIKKPSLDSVVKYVCRQGEVSEKELRSHSRMRRFSEIRSVIGWLVVHLEAATLSEVATRFHRDLTTISRGVRNIEERSQKSNEMEKQLDAGLKALCE